VRGKDFPIRNYLKRSEMEYNSLSMKGEEKKSKLNYQNRWSAGDRRSEHIKKAAPGGGEMENLGRHRRALVGEKDRTLRESVHLKRNERLKREKRRCRVVEKSRR